MADEMSKEEGQQAVADLLAAYQLQINDALTQAVKRGLKVDARIWTVDYAGGEMPQLNIKTYRKL